MKLPMLLGTLLLSASPAVADDFVYLKCKATINNTVFDWTKTKELNHWVSNSEILYKIDTKNEELFASSNPKIPIQYELQHPGYIGWTEQVSDGRISGENPGICNTTLQERSMEQCIIQIMNGVLNTLAAYLVIAKHRMLLPMRQANETPNPPRCSYHFSLAGSGF